MECRNCGDKNAYRVKTVWTSEGPKDQCISCGLNDRFQGLADVWYGYGSGEHFEENIAYPKGHPKWGQPIPFSSRNEKREAMRIAGVKEAGDKKHGSRSSH